MTDAPARRRAQSVDLLICAGLALAAGVVLVAGGYAGAVPLLAVVAVLQAVLIVTWVFGVQQPGRIGALVIAVAAAAAADCLVMVFDHAELGALLPVVGLAMIVLFVHQLTRGVVRNRVVESLSDTALIVLAVIAWAAVIQLFHAFAGAGSDASVSGGVLSGVLGAASVGLAVGLLVDTFAPVPRFDPGVRRGLLGTLLGGLGGAAVGYVRLHSVAAIEFTGGRGAFIGAAVGLVVGLLGVGLGFATSTFAVGGTTRADGTAGPAATGTAVRPVAAVIGALVPLALVSPIGYMLCLAIRA